MWFFKRAKAGALQYVLVVSVLVAIIVFAFISLVFLQQKIQIKNSFYKETIQNVQLGFDFLSKNDIVYDEIQEYKFSENEFERTEILKKHWGLFDLVIIKSIIKNEFFQRTGLLGSNNSKREVLYLKENNKPLVLVGNTKIIGNVSLPKQGVKRGNISGTSYNGNQLIYGNKRLSSSNMPIIKNLQYIKDLFNQNYRNDSVEYFELEDGMEKIQNFNNPLAIYQANGRITLRDVFLAGNIIVYSKKSIYVEKSSRLEDIILIAPEIEIESDFEGNFQVFATKKIKIQKKCKLNYPSALVLIDKDEIKHNSKEDNGIFIDENSDIRGMILYENESKINRSNFKPQVVISENTNLIGEVYCNQNLELLGSVYGSVFANNFITKQFGSVYVNHIYNGVINSNELPNQYCGLPIGDNKLKIAKWLY